MDQVVSFSQRSKLSLREALLDAATNLLPDKGYAGLRMADVATAAGVSRQTVYNEFGNKATLVQAVALRTAAEFLRGVTERFTAAADLGAAVRAAAAHAIEHARTNRLVAAALGTDAGEDLLPLLTSRGEPVLRAATEQVAFHFRERVTALDEAAAELLGETMVRLTLSHLVLPTHTPAEAAEAVCAVVLPAIERYSSTVDGKL